MANQLENRTLGRERRERIGDKTFNRILMEVVGPILIILMIGALVYFLIEIFYRGPHSARLGWVLGLFTIAAVLVSRISIEGGVERSLLFGVPLAVATLVVTITLVDFEYGNLAFLEPVVVGVFIAIVMWSANRLTWDCTMIDDSRDVSSIGLMELIRRKIRTVARADEKAASQNIAKEDSAPEQSKSFASKLFFLFFANSKTRNTPGLWVFYFAIAAFPIFGFGQWFAQPSDGWGYRWIFFLFAVYLGSGLGLLMLTSLLGLERYLNKRGAKMPPIVSRSWMVVGTLFALGIMLIMLMLPSPSISNGLENALGFLTTNNKNTSKHAIGKDGQEEGEDPNNDKVDNDNKDAQKRAGDKGKADGKEKDGKSKGGKSGKSKKGDKGSDQNSKQKSNQQDDSKQNDSKKNNSKQNSKQKNSQRDQSKKNDSDRDSSKSNDKNKNDSDSDDSDKQNEDKNENENQKRDDQNQNKNQKDNEKQHNQRQDNQNEQAKQRDGKRKGNAKQNNAPRPNAGSSVSSVGKFLGTAMRYIVYLVGFIALLVVLWLFRDELAKLWNELFGAKEDEESETKQAEESKRIEKPQPAFSQFQEPFGTGMASKWTAGQTIQYTFQALEAWGRGFHTPREQDQTPHEFAKQLRTIDENVANEAKRLADLHGENLFSDQPIEQADTSELKRLWKLMVANSPKSTGLQMASDST